ncbi:hypothetical protein B0T12DRAFT_132362 [Alternaria alternata]|nr:hypothetical protein B0T12DRAFT_132362 [Alternaria alternata]
MRTSDSQTTEFEATSKPYPQQCEDSGLWHSQTRNLLRLVKRALSTYSLFNLRTVESPLPCPRYQLLTRYTT